MNLLGPTVFRWSKGEFSWAILIVYFVLLGGTPVGELNGWAQAVNGILAFCIIAFWLRQAPRAADGVDLAMLAALLLFLASAVVSMLPRQSFAAAVQVTALVGGFYLARRQLAGSVRERVQITLGWICLFVVALTLPRWIAVWLHWLSLTGWSQAPPLSVRVPPGVFDNRHYLGTLVILLVPALWTQAFRHRWPLLAFVGTVGAACVVVMDASRTLIGAVLVASVVAGLMQARRVTPRVRHTILRLAVIALPVLAVGLILAASLLLERFGNLAKVLSRVALWGNSVEVWLQHPVAGVGPGVFPFSYFFTDYFANHSFAPRHPDNAAMQLLVESGLLGVSAVVIVLTTVVFAARRTWTNQPHAVWALTAFLVACLGTNPSDFIFLLVPTLLWAAMLVPAADWPTQRLAAAAPRSWVSRNGLSIAALPIGAAIVLTSGGSLAYQAALDRFHSGDSDGAAQALNLAVSLDPGESIYWRERGGLRLASGDVDGAREDFNHALTSVPFDPGALRGLALADLVDGKIEAALVLAKTADRLQPESIASAVVLAVAAQADDDGRIYDAALSKALLEAPYFALIPWADSVLSRASVEDALENASRVAGRYDTQATTIGPVLVVLMAGSGDAAAAAEAAIPAAAHSARALAALASCNPDLASEEIHLASRSERESPHFWIASAIVSRAVPQSGALGPRLAALYRGWDENDGTPTNSLISDDGDVWRYRRISLQITGPEVAMPGLFRGTWLLTTDPFTALSGISAWPECS
jgi:O-antigen ligase